ncbi:DUF7147 family protein [Aquibacillus kalidii]|uniref:DUF7147 family protein n=1 Tax=Aquibacillus kalidii TaxID=2762597 RepID=UPI00164898F5|nr:methylthioribose kinase [Aquibacillus kalidii]
MQRFIELGEGYTDIYELFELIEYMSERVEHFVVLEATHKDGVLYTLAIVMKPTKIGNFQPIYVCLEGIRKSSANKRLELFQEMAAKHNQQIKYISVKTSDSFHDRYLYYNYLLGIFQINRLTTKVF